MYFKCDECFAKKTYREFFGNLYQIYLTLVVEPKIAFLRHLRSEVYLGS
jgi:hypothetical protein